MKKKQDIKVSIKYTEGYKERFTKACIEVAKKRGKHEAPYTQEPGTEGNVSGYIHEGRPT